MIAGETEIIVGDYLEDNAYDDFLFFGNKEKRAKRKAARQARRLKRRSAPKRIERREKRRAFWQKMGNVYNELGGGAAIGGAIDHLIRKPQPLPDLQGSNDWSLGQNANNNQNSDVTLGLRDDQRRKESNMPLIIGGVVLIAGVVGVALYQKSKNK